MNGPSPRARTVILGSRGSRRRRQAPRIRSAETAVGSGVTRAREGRPNGPHAPRAFAKRRGRCVESGVVRRFVTVGGVGSIERVIVRCLSCQPNHRRGLAPPRVFPIRMESDPIRINRMPGEPGPILETRASSTWRIPGLPDRCTQSPSDTATLLSLGATAGRHHPTAAPNG